MAGERTGLEKVSKCAEISGGTINVLNPLEISRQLRLISQNYVIATYVTVTLFLHPELEIDDPRYPKVWKHWGDYFLFNKLIWTPVIMYIL